MFLRLYYFIFLLLPSLVFGQYCPSGGSPMQTQGSEIITQVFIGSNITPYSPFAQFIPIIRL